MDLVKIINFSKKDKFISFEHKEEEYTLKGTKYGLCVLSKENDKNFIARPNILYSFIDVMMKDNIESCNIILSYILFKLGFLDENKDFEKFRLLEEFFSLSLGA